MSKKAKIQYLLDLNLKGIAGTITPLAGSANENFVIVFFNNVFTKTKTWMADATNGIGDFFANRVRTKELCVAKADGTEFCANGDQLQAMAGGSVNSGGGNSGSGNSGGNSGTADTTAPVITLTGDANATLNVGDAYTEAGATATDDVDTSIAVVITGSVDTATAGTYTIHYNATDTAGNHATEVVRNITVNAVTP